MRFSMSLILFSILLSVFYHRGYNNELTFEFKRYFRDSKDTTLFQFKINDIEGVDWPNRSFKLKKGLRNVELPCGLYNEYLTVSMGDEIIDTFNMLNPGTSNKIYFKNKSSMLTFHPSNALSAENWLVIFAYPINKDKAFRRNEEIFNLLTRKKLLNYSNWSKSGTVSPTNKINKNEVSDILLHFNSEFDPVSRRALQNIKSGL